MTAFSPRKSSPAFHFGSMVGGLALLVGCALSGCDSESPDGSGSGGTSAATGGTGGTSTSGSGGMAGTGGTGQGGSSQGGTGGSGGTAGSSQGGSAVTGGAAGSGGAGSGGAAGSGAGNGGRDATGGNGGAGGAGGAAGASGGGGSGGGAAGAGAGGGGAGGGGGSMGAMPSAGCGKAPTLRNSPTTTINYNMVTSSGTSRRYILRYPSNYDNMRPYRLVIAYHWNTGSAAQVFDCTQESIRCYTTQSPFYGLWDLSNDTTIFIAPDGLNAGWANANGQDVVFTDDILAQVEADLCIDKSRIFANGFSYGGGMSKAIGCARANVFRAIAVYSGGEFLSGCSGGTMPIAFYGSHGLGDGTLQYATGEQIRDRFVRNNGCTAMNPPEPATGSGMHICTSYSGCSSGHPTRWCAFDGGHDPSPKDRGQSTTWNAQEVWNFITQF